MITKIKIIFCVFIMLFYSLNISAKEIEWDKVIGGVVFGTFGYFMMADGFMQVEGTYPKIVLVNFKPGLTQTTCRIQNSGNCDLKNFNLYYQVETYEGNKIPYSYQLSNFQQGQYFNLCITGYSTSKIPLLVRYKENWEYEKRYKNKNDYWGYGGLAITCTSVYLLLDGLGIFESMQEIGLNVKLDVTQFGSVKSTLNYAFN